MVWQQRKIFILEALKQPFQRFGIQIYTKLLHIIIGWVCQKYFDNNILFAAHILDYFMDILNRITQTKFLNCRS